MKRLYFWLIAGVLYVAFFSWYTSFEGPMRDDEINEVLQRVELEPTGVMTTDTVEELIARGVEV